MAWYQVMPFLVSLDRSTLAHTPDLSCSTDDASRPERFKRGPNIGDVEMADCG